MGVLSVHLRGRVDIEREEWVMGGFGVLCVVEEGSLVVVTRFTPLPR